MRSDEIPPFIFRGAVLSVDGAEKVLRDFSLERPVVNGRIARDDVLYLRFKSGVEMEYDAKRVAEIPGRIPDFLKPGEKIFLRETLADAFAKATNGVWQIDSVSAKQEGGIRLVLKRAADRPDKPNAIVRISRTFNSDTMSAIGRDEPVPVQKGPPEAPRGPIVAPPTAVFKRK
jgi:hypothetical protein